MEAVVYTLKSLGLVTEINECRAVSLCGLVVRVLNQQSRGIEFNPHQGSRLFIHLLWHHSKEQLANLALFSKKTCYYIKSNIGCG